MHHDSTSGNTSSKCVWRGSAADESEGSHTDQMRVSRERAATRVDEGSRERAATRRGSTEEGAGAKPDERRARGHERGARVASGACGVVRQLSDARGIGRKASVQMVAA